MQIRNIAIIAHVDHGKTTLVDAMLKQTHTFRDNQKEMSQTLIMDSNDLEREKGITILAKNTSVFYKDTKINIIDTPGHADFGGEVERTINMAQAAVLLVDAAEGCLPQTRFVLKKALEAKLKIILLINKIDKKDARPDEVKREVENLFLSLAHDESALHFETIYSVGRDGKAFLVLPEKYSSETKGDLSPLFETILEQVPDAHNENDEPFQMLISTLDYDNYVGKLCIGRVTRGKLKINQSVSLIDGEKILGTYKVQKLYTTMGLNRMDAQEVSTGDIVTIAGIPELTIGQTLTDPAKPESLPTIAIEEPTIKITIGPNTSPFAGKEGKFTTSRQIKERLLKEKETNLGLKIEPDPEGVKFVVHGRGELHLAVLIENMRREGFELEVSKPQVIYKKVDGVVCEPYEEVTIEVDKEHIGLISEEMGKRKGIMIDMKDELSGQVETVYKISSANLLGIRNSLLTKTRGTVQINSYFLGFEKKGTKMESVRNGALIASKAGTTVAYGLINAQDRGTLFIGTDVTVYEGMVVGVANRDMDIELNVCKTKQLTNNRSRGEGVSAQVVPHTELSLEQSLDFLGDDELLEVTPVNLRLRKQYLTMTERKTHSRRAYHQSQASV
ncbi:GTP-binding protein TypA [Candidatus Roizmanbacteria bacterium RIFCSPLOWO2_12_FULL_40_12]|uniref:50S ribosomal subunit assembly factor BipA n=1 Tax=Candidatus Roizmanbacteria bacterium RIFCSPLOWO2_01_FULL_40_42 TaxID=1802066 RepID=A0A1F7J4S8_9BACT|nr:MAG: GTP-binding protein TypA [Candidatus Roizmanbacteria bacterium RIFCSPHIGHO2_01_FULL_40_98]OGK27379.1 MAG: GTP-binding protein TypA [Candidatus Roizmanbacteria bacterium RIFCSPHIGHO2_02_FULL_40_53]OGK30749.1 MAG: GTP-binding protein TypA [Candidatus Roizmanbacteria bacterium RIFCSPHIGHO2_12_41_18]OGK36484.1 MAG: GTP-binding protein TypA [Candidatus Roizmanbacteria bacterium RIFCSPHIGHO2_12_FULL_40_130]OGK50612.1 MAG: GTP-binding protein TypA [Candidatus Roizmanbacteria bacterium RIFCSPLO